MVGDGWRLELVNGAQAMSLTRADLEAMPQHTESLPIACVEGWSAGATWTGVRVRELLALVGADPAAADAGDVTVTSLQQRYSFGVTTLQANFAADAKTLLALRLNGETLVLDHGYPARLIAPDRPGCCRPSGSPGWRSPREGPAAGGRGHWGWRPGCTGCGRCARSTWATGGPCWASWPAAYWCTTSCWRPWSCLLGVLAVRLAPAAWRAPMAVGLVVWGGLTIMAVPCSAASAPSPTTRRCSTGRTSPAGDRHRTRGRCRGRRLGRSARAAARRVAN